MKNLTRQFIAAALICLVASQSAAIAQFRGKSGGSKGSSRSSFSSSRSSFSSRGSSQRGNSGGSISSRGSVSRSGSRSLSSGMSRFRGSSSQKGTSNSSVGSRLSQSNRGLSRLPQSSKVPQGTRLPSFTRPGGQSRVPQTKLPQTKFPQTKLPQTKLPHTKLPHTKLPQSKLPHTRLPQSKLPQTKLPLINKPGGHRLPGTSKLPLWKPPAGVKQPLNKLPLNKLPQTNRHPFQNGGIKGHVKQHITQKFQAPSNWKNVVHNIIQHNRRHWCHTRPATCHWWVSYCAPIAHCNINDLIVCDWNRVQCAPVVQVGVPVQDVQWYLGMKGILLPGKGIGIDAVEPGSPAEQVGLRPGMVLTVCNGIPMTDEGAMAEAIRISGGVLNMTILSEDGSQILEGTVRMVQVAAVSF